MQAPHNTCGNVQTERKKKLEQGTLAVESNSITEILVDRGRARCKVDCVLHRLYSFILRKYKLIETACVQHEISFPVSYLHCKHSHSQGGLLFCTITCRVSCAKTAT